MSPSISEEQACAGHNVEQSKNYCFEHDPGLTVRAIISHELLSSACHKQQKSLMVVDGGTLPPGLSVTLQCPHLQASKMSTCSVNTHNLYAPSWRLWWGIQKPGTERQAELANIGLCPCPLLARFAFLLV